MMFNGMFQPPRQGFGMQYQSHGERPDFDMGGGRRHAFGRPTFGGNTPAAPFQGAAFGGNTPSVPFQGPGMSTGTPAMQMQAPPMSQSGYGQSQSPLWGMWLRAMGGR